MVYKTILTGRLEFGKEKTFEKVMQMYQHRVDNFYKNDLLFEEEVFDSENYYLNVPRLVAQSYDKKWRNTVKLLEYLEQFAVAGKMRMWVLTETKVVKETFVFEPKTEKAAVQAYLKGSELIEVKGKENEAINALNKAIEKYERHALAYERRGYVNFQLQNYEDALYDFSKSIDLNPNNCEPFFGRTMVKLKKKDYQGAADDLEKVCKNSIPLQSIYWKARRMKGDCHEKLKDFESAAKEYRFFTLRNFKPNNPNYKWRKFIFYKYGKALMELGNFEEALPAFESAYKMESEMDNVPQDDLILSRGIALQKNGKRGYKKAFKDAADLGSVEAKKLLASLK